MKDIGAMFGHAPMLVGKALHARATRGCITTMLTTVGAAIVVAALAC